jgi:hypothetical protein
MSIEQLIEQLRAPDSYDRCEAIKKIAELASKTSNRKKFTVFLRALRFSAKNDNNADNRQLAKQKIKRLNENPPVFGRKRSSRESKLPKIVFGVVVAIVVIGLLSQLKNSKNKEPIDKDLEMVKRAKVGDLLNPLNVKAITPRELTKGVILQYRPKVGDIKRSHVRHEVTQRSGGRELNHSEVWFDLKRKVIKKYPDKGEYVVEYRTSKVHTPVSILVYGYPEPGKRLRKRIDGEGVVKEISGDIYGIVPAMAFVNNYYFPKMRLKLGSEWEEKKTTDDVTMSTRYRLQKVLKVKGYKYYFVTYKRKVTFERTRIETSMYQYAEGEVYFDYKGHFPIFLKETSLAKIKKFDSKLGLEIKVVKTETFSEAHRILGKK